MGKREYDDKEKPLFFYRQPADETKRTAGRLTRGGAGNRPQHMGRVFPAVGNTLPGRWDSKSQPVGDCLPNSRN